MAYGFSRYFESFSVKGDKITIHKCVINKAIKTIKNDPDTFKEEERVLGQLDILEDLLNAIRTGISI